MSAPILDSTPTARPSGLNGAAGAAVLRRPQHATRVEPAQPKPADALHLVPASSEPIDLAQPNQARPAPPVDAETDLRNLRYMPVDVVRLRDSDFVATANGDQFMSALLLWCASWHQVPAGSLPCDDRVLAQLSGHGRDVERWQSIREVALTGWFLCSDGRLYHRVISEKVKESWASKLKHGYTRFADRARKENDGRKAPTFDQWLRAGRPSEIRHQESGIPPEIQRKSSLKVSEGKGKGNKDQEPLSGKPDRAAPSLEVQEVFAYWQETFNHPKAILDPKRAKFISDRLKEGHSVPQLKTAITGCSLSKWHAGQNDRKTKFHGVHLIFEDAAKVDAFCEMATAPPEKQVWM